MAFMNNSDKHSDITVVGGGMVGAAAALGLAEQGFSVALLEHAVPPEFDPQSAPDLRISALGCTSVALLTRLGAWQNVAQMRSAPYRRLETWEMPGSEVIFDAAALGLPELGYMVENTVLQRALWQQVEQQPAIRLHCPASLKSMEKTPHGWQLTLQDGQTLTTQLVIGADGANSQVRQLAGIGINGWQYRQSCMLISVKTAAPDQDVTWQQFFPSGPRAFLPLSGHYASLVWYDSPARIRYLQSLPMAQLSREIQQAFPERVGNVTALAAGAFPLVRRHAQHYVRPGVALIGDAAHTINPLAGQGVNLGYRDVEALIDVLAAARERGEAWAGEPVLMRYQRRRKVDNLMMQSGMDLFYTAFSNDLAPVRMLRNAALMAAQRGGSLKNRALRYALGL
ncbi:3-demethoxyubiquinol 3-hydroxylase [Chimaeribacter arupi]|nr:3-demethoxyubiquinol 3-hydroxylase [Chimaeribacter arupi]MDV5139589.1 3-demethoxyubiquinol 3-hydroxylase [Chimaeribacter arupi]